MQVRLLGLALFAIAFLLPACRDASGTVYPGWRCAEITVGAPFSADALNVWDVLAVLSGMINPFTLFSFLLSFTDRFYGLKVALFLSSLLFMVCTWAFFIRMRMLPFPGHFFWIAGALVLGFASACMMHANPRR
jgi:hypothetical protein